MSTTITGLTAAGALTGTEVAPVDQAGATVKATVDAIAARAIPQLDGTRGDIVVSASGATWTVGNLAINAPKLATNAVQTVKIVDNAVTLPKLADIATNSLLGRSSAGTGDPEVITVGSGLSFTGTTLNATGGGGSPGGSSGQVQWNNGGAFAGSSGITLDATNATFASWVDWTAIAAPAAPAAGNIRVYPRSMGGMLRLFQQGPTGGQQQLEISGAGARVLEWLPSQGTALTVRGSGPATALGTVSTPGLATTDFLTQSQRTIATTAAAINSNAGWRGASPAFWRGSSAGRGGFYFHFRAGVQATNSDGGAFIGITSGTGAPTSANFSSTINDATGIVKDAADTNWFFTRRNAGGAAVRIDLLTAVAANQVFDMILFCTPNSSDLRVVINLVSNTDGSFTTLLDTTYSTDLPLNTSFLAPRVETRTGTTTTTAQVVILQWVYGVAGL